MSGPRLASRFNPVHTMDWSQILSRVNNKRNISCLSHPGVLKPTAAASTRLCFICVPLAWTLEEICCGQTSGRHGWRRPQAAGCTACWRRLEASSSCACAARASPEIAPSYRKSAYFILPRITSCLLRVTPPGCDRTP